MNTDNLEKEIRKPVSYDFFTAFRYVRGIDVLKHRAEVPFTHEQNVKARVIQYEAEGFNSRIFNNYLDSITGIAFKAHSTRFKIKPFCHHLSLLRPDFRGEFVPVDYESFYTIFDGLELDSSDPKVKYNQDLTREEAKVHPAHIASVNGNRVWWEKYVDMWFDISGQEKGLGFYVRQNEFEDRLSPVVLEGMRNSNVGSKRHMDSYGTHFILVDEKSMHL